ncbi:hypothetical protein M3Y97_00797600 [Aphelenchoides bicaudatus]|nr:hypothetical protein M3Y97_00797600 [Aphelenchoides bicaudatus]
MSEEHRQVQIELAHKRSVQIFQKIDKSLLFTDKNYKEMLSRDEFKIRESAGKLNEGICERCKNLCVFFVDKHCNSCYNLLGKHKKAGTTAPAFDPKKARKGSNYSNQAERSLCYIMKKQQSSLSQQKVANEICNLTGEKSITRASINDWHGKFSEAGFNLKDFVLLKSGNKRGLSGFSEKTIQALVIYLHGQKKDAEQTVTILNTHFKEIHEFSLAEVEAIRADVVEIKKALKRKAVENDQATPAKQLKLKI